MAFSKIVLTFENWDIVSSSEIFDFNIQFTINGVLKSETSKPMRTGPGEFEPADIDQFCAAGYRTAWIADYRGTLYVVTRLANVVTIEANYDGAIFADFAASAPPAGIGEMVTAVITNVALPAIFDLTSQLVEPAATPQCTTVKVTLTQLNGVAPFTWVNPLTGLTGLIAANFPRVGGVTTVEIEDSLSATDTIDVDTPAILDNTAISSISIEGDPSGLHGTVGILMSPRHLVTYQYSLNDIDYQTSNVFNGILPGSYTIYIKDQWGCKISTPVDVTLTTIRPPVYRLIPRSNSFGWFELQANLSSCYNPYNTTNAKPNNFKPTRFLNPKYFQPWCFLDAPVTQFRSNYDTLTAELVKVSDDSHVKNFDIYQVSDNIGQRQIMDARIYDRGDSQTGVYWISGNIYNELGDVISTYTLDGQLPEWAKVGQKFTITGSATDGLFEIKQIIFDSILLVNAAVIDRIYTDVAEVTVVKVDATYNRLNYETWEFVAYMDDVAEGCYKIKLSMTDSFEGLGVYPDSLWETLPFILADATKDLVYIESSDHVDDGIYYGTGIVHKQRFQGLFFEQDFPSDYETSRDSRKALNKLDGRVQSVIVLEAIDVPYWVHEKLALFISKKSIRINNLAVQIEDPFEVSRNPTYTRVNLKTECFVTGYEQYITNAYDIL